MIKRLAILGATGSIGTSALEVIARHPQRFEVTALTAARSVARLAELAREFDPQVLAVLDETAARKLQDLLPPGMRGRVLHGAEGYLAAAVESGADMLLSAMVGAAGLAPTHAAARAGIDIALANKETLVAAGELVMAAAGESGAAMLPVDSEHSAVFQALSGADPETVAAIWLTASGGPFRQTPKEDLAGITPAQALKHPNWAMGQKITIDSATLMNKGLEVIEARWLFGVDFPRIKVVVHPQSIVHSLVEFRDTSLIAQLGIPDMRLPIAYALAYPERVDWGLPRLDMTQAGRLTFEEPDLERFPCLALAYAAGRQGGTAPAALNGANEVAVAAFLAGRLDFLGIPACVEAVLAAHPLDPAATVAEVLEADRQARRLAEAWVAERDRK